MQSFRAFRALIATILTLLGAGIASAAWTPLGDYALSAGMAGPRGAAVPFVAFRSDGALVALSETGRVWQSDDLGASWAALEALEPQLLFRPEQADAAALGPDAFAVRHPARAGWIYGLADDLHLSKDGGATWTALTNELFAPMIGPRPTAIAFDPADPERIFVGTQAGLWRSADGGLTWVGLNAALPNFPSGRFVAAGSNAPPVLEAPGVGAAMLPGGSPRWILAAQPASAAAGPAVDLFAAFVTEGTVDASPLQPPADTGLGAAWDRYSALRTPGPLDTAGAVASVWTDPNAPLSAVAVSSGADGPRVFRTVNGGLVWDDLTADLPAGEIHAVVGSPDGDAVYVGGDAGIFYASVSLRAPSPAASWQSVGEDLPAAAHDLYLSGRTGRLYAAVEGFGIYRRRAPHVVRTMSALNAADLSDRPIAPGGLLTLLGGAVGAATVDGLPAPVLFASEGESQIQAPFQARPGRSATLELSTSQGPRTLQFPIQALSPAIFTESGEPLAVDAGTGRLLDLSRPARPGMRVLVLAAGLGAVDPVWPTGLAAPVDSPPRVVATVSAYLDGSPLRVLDAALAGGYVGAYWVEVELPMAFQGGLGRLVIEAGGNRSNAVGLLLAP